jgi:hypothetical protein
MGTFAETAIVDYRLSFADQGKQMSVFIFNWQQTNGFAVSVFCLQKTNGIFRFPLVLLSVCGILKMWRHGHEDMDTWR